MRKCGIIDPAKVVKAALQNGASIAALLLTTSVVIGEAPEEKEEKKEKKSAKAHAHVH